MSSFGLLCDMSRIMVRSITFSTVYIVDKLRVILSLNKKFSLASQTLNVRLRSPVTISLTRLVSGGWLIFLDFPCKKDNLKFKINFFDLKLLSKIAFFILSLFAQQKHPDSRHAS